MATVNFSVPDDVRKEFDRVFGGRNKSAVIADLMRDAVAAEKRRRRRQRIFRALTNGRAARPPLSDRTLRSTRRSGRP